MQSLQCPLEISSCNTRLTKVKFRLKKTQLKTIFNSRPEGKLFKGNCLKDNCPRGISREKLFGGVVAQRRIIQGQLPGWRQRPEGYCPGESFMGNSCSGENYSGGIVWAVKVRVIIVQGEFHGRKFSGCSYPGGTVIELDVFDRVLNFCFC